MTHQTMLITGGSGTFGSAFIRYALEQGAARVICLSRGEHRQAELKQQITDPRLDCWIGDVRDPERLEWALGCRPDVVLHAAAIKRVEVCEANPDEAFKTNVLGTRHVVQAAMRAGVARVQVISSDKATSPETTYGKTKAAAEDIAIGQNAYRGWGQTRISVARYGNVLGSNGSFLDTLLKARQSGEPIGITDPQATRFWWSADDAVRFVGWVLEVMQGGEIFIPKLASAKVVDLATAIAPKSPHIVTGRRGPEKTHEAMVNATEARYAYEWPSAYVLYPKQGQWWSPTPQGTKVPDGFTYASGDDPLPVRVEAQEAQACTSPS
jgi:UDP-N-acetylglucosamine 4,6-dehydratase